MMNRLRTALFNIVFFGLSVPIVLLAPLAGLFGARAIRGYARGWLGMFRWCVRHLLRIRTRIDGTIPTTPVLIAAKHQSLYETFELAHLLRGPGMVMKQELAQIPVWGWCARRYGVIVVDRSGSATALRAMMRDAKQAVAEGRPVLIFPEGTRVTPGAAPPLQSGFAGLYRMLNLPVVPVALDSGTAWPRKGAKRAGTIRLRFLDPIPPGLPRAEIEARVHAAINLFEREPTGEATDAT